MSKFQDPVLERVGEFCGIQANPQKRKRGLIGQLRYRRTNECRDLELGGDIVEKSRKRKHAWPLLTA